MAFGGSVASSGLAATALGVAPPTQPNTDGLGIRSTRHRVTVETSCEETSYEETSYEETSYEEVVVAAQVVRFGPGAAVTMDASTAATLPEPIAGLDRAATDALTSRFEAHVDALSPRYARAPTATLGPGYRRG